MKHITLLLLVSISCLSCNHDASFLEKDVIVKNIRGVADYELEHPSTHSDDLAYDFVNGWIPSTFYVSLIPLYEAVKDQKYMDAVKKWGETGNWDCAPRLRHADDIACGQVYLDLYRHDKNDQYIKKLKTRMDTLIATRIEGRKDWSWCDALFMAPPVYMMAGNIFNDKKYTNYVDDMYWDVHNYLFDKESDLFFRDATYFSKKSPNGSKLFWGRGNGWVIGGLARLIPYIEDKAMKEKYSNLFKTMAKKIKTLQHDDGLWRSNLLDPNHMPAKETSATGFYVYALSWGVNNGLLSNEEYGETIQNGWTGLSKCIDQNTGKIGWVQPIGAEPGDIKEASTFSYGAGAFVLAGVEMLKYIDHL